LSKVITIERNTDVAIKCYKCGNSYTMDMMRMDPNGKHLACKFCLERRIAPKSAIVQPSKSSAPKGEKMSYFCKACRYSFSRASHIQVNACPYCGVEGSVVSKGSASSLIKEVDDMLDEEE
jgi:DNA-directed RNA polymerase subunit RPC12/RpoP